MAINDPINVSAGLATISINGTSIGWLKGSIRYAPNFTLLPSSKSTGSGGPTMAASRTITDINSTISAAAAEIIQPNIAYFSPQANPSNNELPVYSNVLVHHLKPQNSSYYVDILFPRAHLTCREIVLNERDWNMLGVEVLLARASDGDGEDPIAVVDQNLVFSDDPYVTILQSIQLSGPNVDSGTPPVIVDTDTGLITYTEGTDYLVDYTCGRVFAVPASLGGTITEDESVTVTYTYTPANFPIVTTTPN